MFTKEWLKAAGIRAFKTICQTALSLIGVETVGITDINWVPILSASLLAGLVSLLTSVVTGLPEVDTPSELTDEEAEALLEENPEAVEEEIDEDIEIEE